MYIIIVRILGVNETVFLGVALSYANITVGSLFKKGCQTYYASLTVGGGVANIPEQKTLWHLEGRKVKVKYTRKITTQNSFSQERNERKYMNTMISQSFRKIVNSLFVIIVLIFFNLLFL